MINTAASNNDIDSVNEHENFGCPNDLIGEDNYCNNAKATAISVNSRTTSNIETEIVVMTAMLMIGMLMRMEVIITM